MTWELAPFRRSGNTSQFVSSNKKLPQRTGRIFLVIALLIVGVSVPTPGGVGGFEAAVQIGLTSFYAVPNDRAVGAAIVLHTVSLLPTIVLGFLFVIQDGLGFGGMRNLAHAAATTRD